MSDCLFYIQVKIKETFFWEVIVGIHLKLFLKETLDI